MLPAPIPPDEEERLQALRRFRILDTGPEEAFDDLARLASLGCNAPTAMVTLIDRERQWFKARIGFGHPEIPREMSFCAQTILQDDVLVLDDTDITNREATFAFGTDTPPIRFYAGAPLKTRDGYHVGTICVLDSVARTLGDAEKDVLRALSRQVVAQLELRRLLITEAEDVSHMALMQELSKALVSTLDSKEVGTRLASALANLGCFDQTVVLVQQPTSRELRSVGQFGLNVALVQELRLSLEELPRAERALLVNRLQWGDSLGSQDAWLRQAGISTFAWLPLRVGNQVVGVSLVGGPRDTNAVTEEVESRLLSLSALGAAALNNARLFEESVASPNSDRNADRPSLTDHERDILRLVAQGRTNVQIAEDIHLSRHTVKEYLSNAMRKLGAATRVEAALRATQEGLI